MARKQKHVLAVVVWVIGLLGCTGFINPFGFYALLIPIIFWMFGNRFTKDHCRQYFNILLTAVVIYLLGLALNLIIGLFVDDFFKFTYVSLVYFALMNIPGLFNALDGKRYKPLLSIDLFK